MPAVDVDALIAAKEKVETLQARREELQQQSNNLYKDLSARRTDRDVTQVKLDEASARAEQLRAETSSVAEQRAQEVARLEKARLARADAQVLLEQSQQERMTLSDQRDALTESLRARRDQARQSREVFHQANVRLESMQSQLTVSLTGRDRMRTALTQLEEQIARIHERMAANQKPLPEIETSMGVQLEERNQVEASVAETRKELEASEQAIKALESQRGKVEEAVQSLRQNLEARRVERQGISVQVDNVLEQMATTGHAIADVRAQMPEEATETAWVEEIERMARRISRLGAINLAAIEEFEQESERKQYLDAQATDLEQALETLLEVMHKIDKETRSRFKDTFAAVNTKLGELFPKVFGGGHAYLEMTGDDLLDTGVSLMARPPGKRNASVHLLSGGEKAMTAVALIFAIFHLNPSPVCLLDEVDAPLDDMNVSRFASLIREMSESVQFLVITHNKITMEMADYLMGVTMQEPGVSRLVSVDVEAAAALAIA